MAAYQLVDTEFPSGTARSVPVEGLVGYLFVGEAIIDTDEDLSEWVTAGLLNELTDAQVTAQGGATSTVTPLADSAGDASQISSDGALALTSAMDAVYLDGSTSGAKAITTASSTAGQVVSIFLAAASGGSYTLAVDGGTLTFDAALEFARIQRNQANDGWVAIDLIGATVV